MNKNMKIFYTLGAVVLFLSLCLTGCDNLFQPPAAKTNDGKGLVLFQFGPSGSRTAMPNPDNFLFSDYELTLTPITGNGGTATGAGTPYTKTDLDATSGQVTLLQGWWRVTSVFYADIDSTKTKIADGVSQDFEVGTSTTVTIELKFLVGAAIGTGTLNYTITKTTGSITPNGVEMSFINLGGGNEPGPLSYVPPLPVTDSLSPDAGYYLVKVTLTDTGGERAAVKAEVVHIYPGQTTDLAISFADTDFHSTVVVNAEQPEINTQPDYENDVAVGGTVTLTVVATSPDAGTLSYQWYRSIDGTADPDHDTQVSTSSLSPNFTPDTDILGTFHYYVLVTNTITNNGDGGKKTESIYSGVAIVTVHPAGTYWQQHLTLENGKILEDPEFLHTVETITVEPGDSITLKGDITFKGGSIKVKGNINFEKESTFKSESPVMLDLTDVISGDGEHGEGSLYELALEASKAGNVKDALLSIFEEFVPGSTIVLNEEEAVYWMGGLDGRDLQFMHDYMDWHLAANFIAEIIVGASNTPSSVFDGIIQDDLKELLRRKCTKVEFIRMDEVNATTEPKNWKWEVDNVYKAWSYTAGDIFQPVYYFTYP